MKLIIDLEPTVMLMKVVVFNIIAPVCILFVSLIVGSRIVEISIVKRIVSKVRRDSDNNTTHTLASNLSIIISSILYVLLYNLLICVK